MSYRVKPAMTAEEWASERMETNGADSYDLSAWKEAGMYRISAAHCGCEISPQHFHALAALALHGQPFGFTRAYVDVLYEAAGRIEGEDHAQAPLADALMDLAARIEALLPPEDAK